MTPKQKAIELVDKFIFEHYTTHDYAKQCALMEVNALIEQNGELYLFKSCESTVNYYRQKNAELFEVKTEIEKL